MVHVVHGYVNVRDKGSYYDPDSGRYRHYITISNPSNDYDGFSGAPALLECDGLRYGKASFNSDKGYICYTTLAGEWVARAV